MTYSIDESESACKLGIDSISIPTNVDEKRQLALLPDSFLSDDPARPLLHKTSGGTYKFALKPFWWCAAVILAVESCERFSYNGITFSQTLYLTGIYNPTWSANMTVVQASSFVSAASALTFSSPIIGGLLADSFLGDYWTILLGTILLYIPGLLLIALVAYPGLLGSTYNYDALVAGTLVLWPLGAGALKSIVNVMGAKQYHPILQIGLLEKFYVYYYMMLNIGALAGGIVVPLVAETSVAIAYTLPVVVFSLGLITFVLFSSRYVRIKPEKEAITTTLSLIAKRLVCRPFEEAKVSNGGSVNDGFVEGIKNLLLVIPISTMVIPFCLVYFQLATVFVTQGTAMADVGFIDASMMNNLDAISVLLFGYIMSTYLYPFLSRRYGIIIPTTIKFAIGTALAGLSVLGLIIIDYAIKTTYNTSGGTICILWQTFSYVLVGGAKIFCFSAVYEVTFQIAPRELKGLASSIMLLINGAGANFLSVGLYQAFEKWFPVAPSLEDYADATHFVDYLWVVFAITASAAIFLALPGIRCWVEGIKQAATIINHNRSSREDEEEDVETESQRTASTESALEVE